MSSSPTLDILRMNLRLSEPQESVCSEHLGGGGVRRISDGHKELPTFPQQLMTVSVKLQRAFSANDHGLRRGLNAHHNYPGSAWCTSDARDPLCGPFKQ